jgi:hypothetical protein
MDLSSFVNLTDEGLQYISEMKDLEYLGLNGTKITDEGLCYLKGKKKKSIIIL